MKKLRILIILTIFLALLLLSGLTVIGMGAVIGTALLYAKPALNLAGDEQAAQRIFYIHMGSVMGALVAFLMSLIGSVVP